ncbi:PAS domain-containing protein [Nocardioides pyridinolyticus]
MTAEEQLEILRQRMDNAQQLANMGDYDWHIPTDTNRWSDQLYRIYGYEPQAFAMTYERFMALVHPEDREVIRSIHQHAYATGEPYEMVERIVRPNGEVRYLHSNGQVMMGPDGSPERMRGTCIDVTDQVLAEREREAAAVALHEQELRRRQTVEINDNIVQGLTAALYALELGEAESCRSYLDATLAAARSMMEPDADLVRTEPASLDQRGRGFDC